MSDMDTINAEVSRLQAQVEQTYLDLEDYVESEGLSLKSLDLNYNEEKKLVAQKVSHLQSLITIQLIEWNHILDQRRLGWAKPDWTRGPGDKTADEEGAGLVAERERVERLFAKLNSEK